MKNLSRFLAIAITAAALTHAQPSKATVGACLVSPVTILVGVGMVATGSPFLAFGDSIGTGELSGVGGALAFFGLIVLDGEGGRELKFTNLSKQQASKLGINEENRQNYNMELDQVNMILSEVTEKLSEIKKPTAKDSAKIWSEYKDMLSPETFAVLGKISTQSKK